MARVGRPTGSKNTQKNKQTSTKSVPKQQSQNTQQQNPNLDDTQFIETFAKALNLTSGGIFLNPYIQNEILKDINMHPNRLDRDSVEELLANPRQNEKALRELSQYLEFGIMQYNRMIDYYAKALEFDYTLEPTNADAEDMKSKPFKKAWNKALDFLDSFELKQTGYQVMRGVLVEDVKYYYIVESELGVRLQELPSDYCKIDYLNELGYQFSFNMSYFLRPGVSLDGFPPEFTEYYNNFLGYKQDKSNKPVNLNIENHNGNYFYWQQLDPNKTFCPKFSETHAGITPPFAGLFIDASEIDTFRRLMKTKSQLETWKLLVNKIPLHKNNTTGNSKNDFAITADVATIMNNGVQAIVPEGVKSITTPFEETNVIDFSSNAQTKNNTIGLGNELFWETSGATRGLFGGNNLNGITAVSSNTVDMKFVEHMYRQFEIFINNQLRLRTGRYRFRIHLQGNLFSEQQDLDNALKLAQSGIITDKLAASMHMTPREMDNMINLMASRNYPQKLIPLASSFTTSSKDNNNEGGRETKSREQLSDSGEKSRDKGDLGSV